MRVICIDAKDKPFCYPVDGAITEGEIYTVVRISNLSRDINDRIESHPVYLLEGISDFGFGVERFIPLSEIDEMELELINSIEEVK
jgi:hypothetical protein